MKEYPVCHTTVKGGIFDSDAVARVERLLDSHNFVNRLDLLVKTSDLSLIRPCIIPSVKVKKLVLNSTLSQLVGFILSLEESQRGALKLVTLNKDVTHEDSICITGGKLTLKLRSDQYLKSGFQFKKSAFSRGNKNLKGQMYIHSFDMVKFEENVKNNSKNDIRLLWYGENISTDSFKLILTSESDNIDTHLVPKLVEKGVRILENLEIQPQQVQSDNVLCPNLDIVRDEDSLSETLEWLVYVSLGGSQLQHPVDPFISRYPLMLESTAKTDLTIISFEKSLISSQTRRYILKSFYENLDWFAILSYGVKNVTRSYNNSGEHTIVNDGTNDIVLFSHDKKYALWEVTDSGDPH